MYARLSVATLFVVLFAGLLLWQQAVQRGNSAATLAVQLGHASQVSDGLFSDDDRFLITTAVNDPAGPQSILWNAVDGRCIARFPTVAGSPPIFMQGDRAVLVAGRLYSTASGKLFEGVSQRSDSEQPGRVFHAASAERDRYVVSDGQSVQCFAINGASVVEGATAQAPANAYFVAVGFHQEFGPIAVSVSNRRFLVQAVEPTGAGGADIGQVAVDYWDSVQLSPCGRWVVVRHWPDTGDSTIDVSVFDCQSGELRLKGHCWLDGDSPAWSEDGSICALGIGQQKVRLYSLPGGELIDEFESPEPVRELEFHKGSKVLDARGERAVSRYDLQAKTVSLISPAEFGSQVPNESGSGDSMRSVAMASRSGDELLVGPYLLRRGGSRQKFGANRPEVTLSRTELSPTGDRVLVHGTVASSGRSPSHVGLLLDANDATVLSEIASPGVNPSRLVFDDKMEQAITQFRGGYVVWDLREVKRRFRLFPERRYSGATPPNDDQVRRVRFSPNGRFVYSAGKNTQVKIWDARTGQLQSDGQEAERMKLERGQSLVSPDGVLALSIHGPRTFQAWDLLTGKSLPWLGKSYQAVAPEAMAWSSDSSRLALLVRAAQTGRGYELHLWNRAKEGVTWRLGMPFGIERQYGVPAVTFTPDGSKVVVNGRSRILQVVNVATGQLEHVLQDETKGDPRIEITHRTRRLMPDVLISPDSSMVIAQYGTQYTLIWSLADGSLLHRIDDDNGNIAADRRYQFSDDSSRIRCVFTRPFQLLDVGTWKAVEVDDSQVWKLEGFGPVAWQGWLGRQVSVSAESERESLQTQFGIKLRTVERSQDGKRLCLYPGDQSFYMVNADSPELGWRYYVLEQGYSMVGAHVDGSFLGDGDYILSP